jgi:hypothetical protein
MQAAPATQMPQQKAIPPATYPYQAAPTYPGPAPAPKNGKKTVTIVAVIAIIAVVAILIIAAMALSAGRNPPHETSGLSSILPAPDIRYVSCTYSQATISGDLTVKVDVTNLGDAIGTSTLAIYVHEGSDTFSNSGLVTLAPDQTKTVTIVVNTPFGTGINGNMFDVYIDGDLVA